MERDKIYPKKRITRFFIPSAALLCFLSAIFLFSVDAQAFQIKRVLRGAVSVSTGTEVVTFDLTTNHAELSTDPLVPSKTILLFNWSFTAGQDSRARTEFMGIIDDGTHLLFQRRNGQSTAVNIEYMLVEFSSGVTVYSGVTTVSDSSTGKTITFTTAPGIDTTKAFPLLSFRAATASNNTDEKNIFSADIINSTQFVVTRSEKTNGDNYNTDITYQIVAFDNTEQDINVQKGTADIDGSPDVGESTDNGTVLTVPVTSVDTSKSFLIFNVMPAAAVNGIEQRYLVDGRITGATQLTFTRTSATSAVTIYWYLIEFKNNVSLVQGSRKAGLTSLIWTATGATDFGANSVYSNRAFAVYSLSGGGLDDADQSGIDDAFWRLKYDTPTGTPPTCSSLVFTRTAATSIDLSYFIVELPPLNLKNPNGGGTPLRVGDPLTFQWEHAKELETGGTHADGSVKIKLMLDKASGTGGYPWTIASGLSSKVNSYTWTIQDVGTNVISSTLRVRIVCEEVYTSRNYDDSNADFEIKGKVTVTAPNGSENWTVGSTSSITWNKTGDLSYSTFSIMLSEDGGLNYNWTIATGVTGTATSWTWTVDDKIGNNRKVRVFLAADSANVKDESDANFYVRGKLQLTSPNGSESLLTQNQWTVTWNKWGTFSTVSLYYTKNSGGDGYPYAIITGTAAGASTGSYAWTVPEAAISSGVRVKIVSDQAADLQVSDTSDADFAVNPSLKLNSPNGAEVWYVGDTTRQITWSVYGSIANVHCWYSKDAGPWTRITPAGGVTANQGGTGAGSYTWPNIPDIISDNVLIRVAKYVDDITPATPYDDSDAAFKVKGRLIVTSPDSGTEVWIVNSIQNVTWTTKGTLGNIRIKFAQNGSDFDNPGVIAASLPAANLAYTWTIPDNPTASGKIRIELISDPTAVTDDSNNAFSIKGAFTLTAPNGGGAQSFNVNEVTAITWTSTGTVGNVELRYSTDGGSTYPAGNTIISGIAQNASPFNWTVPDAISSQVKVRVAKAGDESFSDPSDANFSIKGSLTLTSPSDGTEKWEVGTLHSITWTRAGNSMGDVKLDYSRTGGEPYSYPIAASTPSSNLSYSWTIPDAIGNQLKVKITLLSDTNTNDPSNNNFSIIGKFTLTRPTGSETWYVGTAENIDWSTYGSVNKVNLYYSTNSGSTYSNTIESALSNIDGYAWTIPDAIGSNVRVKVENFYDINVWTVSPADFTIKGRVILNSPNGNEVWRVGEVKNVTWTPYGSIGNVKLEYSTNGGSTYPNTITASVPAINQSYTWTIPDAIGTNLKVKITSLTYTTVSDESNAPFEIKGAITLTAPNSVTTFYVGDSTNITWTMSGTLGNVELRYSTDAGSTYPVGNTIITGIVSTATPYAWTIPDAIGAQLRVKVLLLSDPNNVSDDSNNNFTIKGKLRLNIPNGTESWEVGSAQNITWSITGSIANVKLEYSTDSGTTYPNLIIASTNAAVGTYAWSVPDAIGAALRVKVSDASDSTVSDASDANFAIKGKLVLAYPNGAETLTVGSSCGITWSTFGTVPKVNLYYSTDAGSTYNVTITSALTNTNSFTWTVPDAIGSNVRIKVENFDNTNVYDTSNGNFTIKGSVTLTYPNGAETLIVDEVKNITWTKQGSIGNVKLEYSTDGGSSYPNTIAASVPAGDLACTWTIPDAIGANLKVKITSLTYTVVNDESNGVFAIRGSVDLTTPDGGEAWGIGELKDIVWTKKGSIGNVKLEYSLDGGSTYPNVIIASVPSSNLSYSWTIPNNPTIQARVKITALSDSNVTNSSQANFRIRGSLTVNAPNGSETWNVGTQQNITWSLFGAITNVRIEYSTDGGTTYPNIVTTSTAADSGSYAWTIPDAVSSQLRVKITDTADSTVTDTSNANFTIKPTVTLNYPNGGEVFVVNTSYDVTWIMVGTIANVKLEYSTDGGSTYPYTIISSTPAAALSYSWQAQDTISNTCKVRVSNSADSSVSDVSNAYFKIKGSLTVSTPNGGEGVSINSPYNITWTKQGSVGNCKLEYSTDAGSTYPNTIVASVPAANLLYAWTIPDTPSSQCRLKITSLDDSTVTDASNNNFSIKGSLYLNAPNGGETWYVNTTQSITWSMFGALANVKLEYSTDSGSTYPNLIIASTSAAALSYPWNIPDAIGTTLRVKITDTGDASVTDSSVGNFTVKGSVQLSSPNGSEIWKVGENRSITWTKKGSIGNIKLEYSTNAGSTYPNTIVGAIPSSDLTYSWPVADAIGTQTKIKITALSDTSVTDESDGNFIIKGILVLTAPNGSENWIVGTSQNITWNRTGSIGNVKLEYATDGVTHSNLIIASTPAASGSYAWTIPDAIGSQLNVKVSDAADSSVSDTSNANFNIKGSLVITSPNGAEAWGVGSIQSITWTRAGSIANVKLEYSTDSGSTYPNLIVGSTSAAAGTFSWTIPDNIYSTVRVKITDTTDTSVTDISNANFKIIGSLTLTAPNGADEWVVSSARSITWTKVGSIANIKLEYSTNSGSTYPYTIIASTSAAALSYTWTIPNSVGSATKVKISDATDSSVYDASDANFTIMPGFTLNVPNGAEVWVVGTSQDISWSTFGDSANIKLTYSTDSGSTYPNTIIASTTNTGSYSWPIPDAISTLCRVKVQDVSFANAFDTSNANFKIKGSLTVSTPNGGEGLPINSSYNITWTKQGSVGNCKLEYSTDAGSTYPNTIVASVPAANLLYAWTIPDNLSTQARVKITDASDSTVSDTSNNNFTIKGVLTITAPDGGETWTVNTTKNITWSKTGSIANVKLEYSTNGGTSYPNLIIASTSAAALSYPWNIPDAIGTTLRVKITDVDNANTFDTSNANFNIKGSVQLISPNGSEIWKVGENRSITWTKTGTIGNVKLEYSTNAGSTYPNLIVASVASSDLTYSWPVADAISDQLKVKITAVSDSAVSDESDGNFIIKGSLALTSPNNGTEVWIVETSQNITWNRTGSIANVKLEYSTNAGSTYPNLIIGSTSAASGTYAWTIPDAIGSQLRIKVSDASDASVSDTSDNNFTIKGALSITAPNGAEAWGVGTVQNITWNKAGTIANVKLEYSTDSGSTYPNLIVGSTSAAAGTFAWTIPDNIGSTMRVKITNTADSTVYDTSNANFKIVGILTLSAPNGAEAWGVDTSRNITWTKVGAIANVRLDYSTNAGSTYPYTIVASTPAGALSYAWTIPDTVSNQVRVKISDASDVFVSDTSDANFTIEARFTMNSPNGGEVWLVNSSHDITWSTIGTISNVRLEYSTDGGSSYPNLIINSTPNTFSYPWVIPDSISSSVRVKISDVNNANALDTSNNNFKIRGNLTVTSPNNGTEAWIVGSSQNITWSRTGSIANVKLEYSTDGGSTYPNLIVASTSAAAGVYSWTIPNNLSQTAKVKITDASDSTVYDESNANFKIRGDLTLTSPNGAEEWLVNSSHNITWTLVGSIANVKLEYSTNGGTSYPNVIIGSTSAVAGSYSWQVPDAIGSQVRVRVSDASDSTVNDVSNANFTIKGVLRIISPNGGETWEVAASRNITWTVTGTITQAKLEYSTNSGSTYPNTIIASTDASTGTYAWNVPDSISNLVRVKISNIADSTVNDASDADFKIAGKLTLNAPNGGEVWPVGSAQSITWARVGSIANVKLEYSTDGGVNYTNTITTSTSAATLSYGWTIPDTISTTVKVRISDVSDPTNVLDTSDNNFKIRGNLVLNSPNGSEVWIINSNHDIIWTRYGSIANVKLEYSTDGGSTYSNLIVASTGAAAQIYNWTIPDSPSIQVRVRLMDTADSTVFDVSDANFIIRGGFTIATPNGNENWPVNAVRNITWSTFGSIVNVKLDYSTDAGTSWNVITNSVSNVGTYAWTIPDSISAQCRVRVSDVVDTNALDISDANFKIHGALTLTSPNGGNEWQVGSSQNITWNRSGSIANVKLEYSTNGGSTYPNSIIASTPAGALSYSWGIPDAISNQVKVRISDVSDPSLVLDVSDNVFKIKAGFNIISPNGGETWTVATVNNLTWSTQGTVANVKLEYSTNAGSSWNSITNSTANTASYPWTVTDTISNSCRIRVSDTLDSTASDASDNNFKIRGNLVITSPNGGEKWNVGSNQVITWDRVGSIATVKLEFSNNGGGIYSPIVSSTGNTGSYGWTIPDSITTQAKVRITNVDDATVTDDSNALFKIQGTLTLNSPNGAEIWMVYSTQNIAWSTIGTINNVKLDYSIDGGSNYNKSIAASLVNTGTYSWTLPDDVSGSVRVRVSDFSDAEAFDTSNANFRIRAGFTLSSPNGGQQWKVSQINNITWTTLGTITNVKLQYSRDNFFTDIISITNSTTNSGLYAWTIPDSISDTVRVRVSDPNDSGAYDDSNNTFRITADFTVTSPNGSEMWDVSSYHSITWAWAGTVSNVKIEYSTNGGGSYPYIIAATSNSGAYNNWQVPDTISAQFKVKVSDLADSTAYDVSNDNAKIKAAFTVTSPNSGSEVWTVGEAHNITWTWTGTVANVKLDYSTNNFGSSTSITSSVGNTGTYAWTIPDAISTTVKVRVMSTTDTDAYDISNNSFKIRGALVLNTPNGGEDWRINQANNITWSTTGTIANVQLLYSTNSGSTYPNTIIASTANLGSYAWTIPNTPSPNARVRVLDASDSSVYDDSNANFGIRGFFTLLTPNGGEAWIVGTSRNITWTWGGNIGYKLSYSTNSGSTYPNVIVSVADYMLNTGTYAWTIPDNINSAVRVKIEDPADANVSDTSNADFKIRGAFTVTAPNGPITGRSNGKDAWVTNEVQTITWTAVGTINNVKLQYSKDDFVSNINTIVASTANTGSFNWTIPDDRSTTVKVRLVDVNDNTVYDDSDANFKITHYTITWKVVDLLTYSNLDKLTVSSNESPAWAGSGLVSSDTAPIIREHKYGNWSAKWTRVEYGDRDIPFVADKDQTITVLMETQVVHVWEARTLMTYDATSDRVAISSTLMRDGSNLVRLQDGSLVPIATVKCDVNIYDVGTLVKNFTTTASPDAYGFYYFTWNPPTGLQSNKSYQIMTTIDTATGGSFTTPTIFTTSEAATLKAVQDTVLATQNNVAQQLTAQQNLITAKMEEQKGVITIKMDEGVAAIRQTGTDITNQVTTTLTSFETKSDEALTRLQTGADRATEAGAKLTSTAQKYSWKAAVSPNPALKGSYVTLTVQGPDKIDIVDPYTAEIIQKDAPTNPMLDMYTWDNKVIVQSLPLAMFKKTGGLFSYGFTADDRFDAGKAFTYIVSDSVTNGMVTGSGIIEGATITSIQGLVSQVPLLKTSVDEALEGVNTLETILGGGDSGGATIFTALEKISMSIDKLPETLSKEGPSAVFSKKINEIAERLSALAGEEGYDFKDILEGAVSDSPTIKEIRGKTDAIEAVINLLQVLFEAKFGGVDTPVVSTSLAPGSVRFRVVAVNPSKTKAQYVPIKVYLPEEVKTKDIMDLGGMDIEYDSMKNMYYVYKAGVELPPAQVRVFEVEVEDIWIVPQEQLDAFKNQANTIAAKLEKTDYYATVRDIADSVCRRLDEIARTQADETVTREQHIGTYRNNLKILDKVKEDIAKMEKILTTAGGPISPEMLAKTKIKLDQPSHTATWAIIFSIIIFIGLLGGVFFFTWHHQAGIAEKTLSEARKAAFPESGPEAKKEKGPA